MVAHETDHDGGVAASANSGYLQLPRVNFASLPALRSLGPCGGVQALRWKDPKDNRALPFLLKALNSVVYACHVGERPNAA